MIRAVYGLMGIGLCLVSAPSMANLSLVNYNGFEVRQSGNTWSFSHEPPSSTSLRGGTVLNSAGVSTSQRALVASHKIPVGKGLPVDVVARIPAGNFARAIVAAGKVATPIGAVITAVEVAKYLNDLGITDVRNTPEGLIAKSSEIPEGSGDGQIPDGYKYRISDALPWSDTQQDACSVFVGYVSSGPGRRAGTVISFIGVCTFSYEYETAEGSGEWRTSYGDSRYWYTQSSGCPSGQYSTSNGCSSSPPPKELTEQQIIDKIALDSGWPTSAAIAAQKAINMGVPIKTEAPTVSGPANIIGEKTTTTETVQLNPGTNTPAAPGATNTQPGTKTTTKTQSTNASYSGSNVSTNTTTNTITNITNNVTNITTTETNTETKEDDQKEEERPVDTPLGDIPELYKKKYPEGISGVVSLKIEQLRATPLFRLPSLLMPNLPESGTCPSWQVDLSLASWADMGTHTVQAPCMVWDFGKVIILVSALLLARRLIFGG